MRDDQQAAQPGADPGFRVDGPLPPGFDVLGTLRRMYPGVTLARGTVIPLGSARITVTAETLHLDLPVAAAPPGTGAPRAAGAAPTPARPPDGSSPQEMVAWVQSRMAAGAGPHVTVSTPQVFTISSSGAVGPGGAGTLDLASLLAAARMGDRDAVRSMVTSQLGMLTGGGAESIRSHDPAFSEADLIARAQNALAAITGARAVADPRGCWRFLQPALFDRERMQIDMLAASGRRQVVEEFAILSATIESLGGHDGGDHATVRMRVGGIARVVDRKGKRVDGDRRYTEWHERVVMQRGPGAMTAPGGDRCPNCEAGIDASATVCPRCGHQLPPGQHDWLVQALLPREPAPRR